MRLSDFGMPKKFHRWRPGQMDAVIQAVCSDTRFTVLNLPPGTGKSPMYVAASRILEGRTLILTQTKGLQTQLMNDFSVLGLREIKGQANYPCIMLEDEADRFGNSPGCDEGPCHAGIGCELKDGGCHYYDALRIARKSNLVITNYSYWMHINRYAEPDSLGEFDTLVLDEAHEAVNTLSSFITINLNRREVKRLIQVTMLRSASIDEWVEWAEYALAECRKHLEASKVGTAMFRQSIKVVRALKILEAGLEDLQGARRWKRTDAPNPAAWVPGTAVDWVVEEDSKGATFQPVWPTAYSESYLFNHVKRILLTSATVTKKDARFLGIDDTNLTYRSYPSPFPKENRPVVVVPTVGVGRNMTVGEERIWINRIDQIIDKERRGKGIIHAISYARAKFIYEHSRHRDILLIHDSHSTRSVVDAFKRMKAPAVLISPSVSTGWDFPYDECRFQIIAKIPFIDNRPLVVNARSKQDRSYLNYVAMVALIQMAGRGVRAEDDRCTTYIIDDNWRWFRGAINPMMPQWFKSALRVLSSGLELDRL